MDSIEREVNTTLQQKQGLKIQLEVEKSNFINELKKNKGQLKKIGTIKIIKISFYTKLTNIIKNFFLKY